MTEGTKGWILRYFLRILTIALVLEKGQAEKGSFLLQYLQKKRLYVFRRRPYITA